MLRYEYRNIYNTRIRPCKECLDYNSCSRYSRKYSNEYGECMYGRFGYKHPEITEFNATWVLLQIKREILNSRVTAESVLQEYRLESYIFKYDMPTIDECTSFVAAMIAYQEFIRKRTETYDKLKRDKAASYIAFVNSLLDTKIKSEGYEVMVYSRNEPLVEVLKDAVLKEKYMFRTIISIEEANKWWAPIMKENYVTY